MAKWCEIFRTGQHRDSKGRTKTWTLSDLEKMKFNYENVHNLVPICCGHPKNSAPAYGWFDKLKLEPNNKNGYSLFSTFKNVLPEFVEANKKGLFKTRSLSIDPDLNIRHLAFLGGGTPAIKGLEQFCFSQNEENDIVIEFNDTEDIESQMNDENKSALAEPEGGAGAFSSDLDRSICRSACPSGAPHSVRTAPACAKGEFMTPEEIEALKTEAAQKDEKINQLEADKMAQDDKIKELEKQIKDKENEAQIKEFADWTDSMIKEGRILPAQKNDVINILNAVNSTDFEFSDESTNPVESFKKLVSNIKQFEFNDIATKENADPKKETYDFSDGESYKEAIIKTQAEYAKKGIELNAAQALDKIKEAQ